MSYYFNMSKDPLIANRPLSLYESNDSSGKISLKELCDGKLEAQITNEVTLDSLINLIIRGGWKETINLPQEEASKIIKQYIYSVIENINKESEIKHSTTKITHLLKALAKNECKTLSNNKLNQDIEGELHKRTIKQYLDELTRFGILDNIKPVTLPSRYRIKEKEKRHFTDPSIAVSLLNIDATKVRYEIRTLCSLFESLVLRDLKIYAQSFNAKVFYYEDYKNKHIDAIIKLENGEWCAFNIRLGAAQIEEAAKDLIDIKKDIEEEPKIMCIICGTTNAAYKREDGVYVVPVTALKN